MQQIKDFYIERKDFFSAKASTLNQKYDRFSIIRLLIFIAAVAIIILLWSAYFLCGIIGIIVFLFGFYRFVLWHQDIKNEELHLSKLSVINDNEASVLEHDYSMFQDGEEFLNPEHPYGYDLDIFGDHSFFQYCNRTTSSIGKLALAEMLQETVSLTIINDRQDAIKELTPLVDWRQDLQAFGARTKDQLEHLELLKFWLKQSNFMLQSRLYQAALLIAPVLSIIALTLAFYYPWWIAILPILPTLFILRRTVDKVTETHRQTTHADDALAHYSKLVQHIENQSFNSPLLLDLASVFTKEGASQQLKKLSYIISQLNVRYNAFAFLLNVGGLWDLHWVYRLEKWKEKNRDFLPLWLNHLAKFEAFSSFANLYYNNPDWVFPQFHSEKAIQAVALGHPLIQASKRVGNDFKSPTSGHIKLITGSNMAGKSTFLRTIGLNIVLANIGLPVCAKKLELPQLSVYTSMRTQDALHESTSSFYAELKRLKFIIQAVERGDQIYFLLDEILKGTNSRDRHTGSKALIKQLIEEKGGGIIATHDLELGQLEEQYGGAIENLRIEVEIQDGKLHFDYKLKKGISESFNATILMQQMGIKVE